MFKFPKEDVSLEYKKCQSELPKDLWPTYSSFANTYGGTIILGVSEKGNDYEITGVQNVEKVLDTFWVTVKNPEKVSKNILDDRCVKVEEENNKTIIKIQVPEAHISDKPIYLNNNPKKAYIRRFSSDQLVTNDEMTAFFRNRSENQDNALLNNYELDDLNLNTIEKLKRLVTEYTHDNSWYLKTTEEFLQSIGVMVLDRQDNRKHKFTEGSLLLLGTEDAIRSRFPHFHLEYLDKRGANTRYRDRISFGDLKYPDLNLLEFYLAVIDKLKMSVEERFELRKGNLVRQSSAEYVTAIREAFINLIIHADYHNSTQFPLVEIYDDFYRFTNPGGLRVTKQEYIRGGQTKPRNSNIATIFRRIGLSERIGSGGPTIFQVSYIYNIDVPVIEPNLTETKLTIWNRKISGDIDINVLKEQILSYMDQTAEAQTVTNLMNKFNVSRYRIYQIIEELEECGQIKGFGSTRGKRYIINR